MRLGRSIAALGGALALVAAGAALTSPAAADASDFRLNDDSAIRTAPTAAVTVSGTGCAPVNGKPSTVAWGLITNGGNGNAAIRDAVTAGDDGSWTVTVDIPAGGPHARWMIVDAGCADAYPMTDQSYDW